jgi:hypothetical protein
MSAEALESPHRSREDAMPEKHTTDQAIYQLKVTLKDIKPPIWRRLEVPGDITLYTHPSPK